MMSVTDGKRKIIIITDTFMKIKFINSNLQMVKITHREIVKQSHTSYKP